MFNRKKIFYAIVIICCLGILTYGNGLLNGFVRDDTVQIVRNTVIHSLANIPVFFTGSTFYTGSPVELGGTYYKPIMSVVFSIIYTFFKENSIPFHIFQLCIHILSTILLYIFLKKFFRFSISILLSLVFLVHPGNSETVFYISGLQEVLFFFFGLLALTSFSYLRNNKILILTFVLLFISCLSKETGILFLIMMLLYVLFFEKKKIIGVFVPLISVAGVYFLLRNNAVGLFQRPISAYIDQLDLVQRILNVPEIVLFYIKLFILPYNLSSSYQWAYNIATLQHFYIPLLLVGLVMFLFLFVGMYLFKSHQERYLKLYIFFFLWFLVGIALHSQIIPLDSVVSERWLYFPMVGLLGIAGVVLSVFKVNLTNKIILSLVCMLIALLSMRTIVRSFDWKDDLTLATRDVLVSPEAYDLENIISIEMLKRGLFEEARIHAERSVKLFATPANYNSLGLIYLNMGNYENARKAFTHGMKLGNYYSLYENMALLGVLDNDSNTIEFVIHAVSIFPQSIKLWEVLAILEYQRGNTEAAKKAITKAYNYSKTQEVISLYRTIQYGLPLDLKFITH
jgi:protein O-mannosyl-transferase